MSCSSRFHVFTAVKIQVIILWVVTPYSVVVGYQHFEGPCIFWIVTPCSVVVGYQHFG